ncbi:MAG TPA: outer membrane beta-barrel protein [Longimicrobiales bacterium]|nr:outer membrane beta-barrel protein [Longimicrobiales bacterium]
MTARTTIFTLLATTLLALSAIPAHAQDFSRDGFFIGFGLGYGSLGIEDASDREGALSGYLKLGGSLNESVLLGVESSGWVDEEAGATLSFGNLSGIVQFYPSTTNNFYLKAGAGLARIDLDLGIGGSGAEAGLGLVAGAGIDIPLGSHFALTPYANFNYGNIEDVGINVFQFGAGVSWY